MRSRLVTLLIVLLTLLPTGVGEAAQIGDGGHFLLQFAPELYVRNAKGEAFTVTLHRYVWPVEKWNVAYTVTVTAPDGETSWSATLPHDREHETLAVPAGAPGVYTVAIKMGGYGLSWVECSLPGLVAHCGDLGPLVEGTPGYRPLLLHAMAPRRWTFYVPEGVDSFEVQQVIGTWQSHREDYGIVVLSPRGQRMAALYGGLSVQSERPKEPIIIRRTIETDAGSTGRFWSLWVTGGDSHSFTDMRIVLKGVPPYVAPTPEQWFDPRTGEAPPRLVYDSSPIRHVPPDATPDPATGRPPSTDFYKWAPVPYLGDEDYNGFRGRARVYLWNPDNRSIDFGAGSYLVDRMPVTYTLFDPAGRAVYAETKDFTHKGQYFVTMPPRGGGVYRMDVEAASWYAWTRPAVPMVLAGAPTPEGHLFRLQIGVARHWYFRVPAGTERFRVGASVADPNHVLSLEIHAPDRLIHPAYIRGGAPETIPIEVPDGLDGLIWFLRTDVGSPTRYVTADPARPTHVRIDADLLLDGVPGLLAPSWGQWFDPDAPPAAEGGR